MLAVRRCCGCVRRRLYGRRAAFFAAALFAVLGPTLHLGAFATYDALSLFLVALAAWCVVRAGERGDATGWMVAAGTALALANAAAYSSALFDPIVIALALLIAFPARRQPAAARCLTLLAVMAVLLTAGVLVGGSSYASGIKRTTLDRATGSDSALTVLAHSWSWTGLVTVLASARDHHQLGHPAGPRPHLAAGGAGQRRAARAAGTRQPAHRASLNKHVGLGAWFAAIAAGYAADKFIAVSPAGRNRAYTCAACVIALAFPLILGAAQSREFSTDWPDAYSFISILRPLAAHGTGHLLVEDPSIAEYYLPPAPNGNAGPAPATSCCPPAPAPAARPAPPASPATATPASSPNSSPRATSTSSR